ncbi:hypothetical protein ACFSCZ_11800 [Siminovitchia sediminis]|uniref:CpXC domain-containing protein n=1 Tax=Siminovitchia sediminis TaxID=1274353 RepID=A0ABW4KKV3_9BACI
MKSKIVVGCKTCEKNLLKKHFFTSPGLSGPYLPFPVQTAFEAKDLPDLMLGFTCDFCGRELPITTKMLKFAATFLDKRFHIHVINRSIFISNGELSITIPIGQSIESIEDYLGGFHDANAPEMLPTEKDIQLIQEAVQDFDPAKWHFTLKSEHTENAAAGYDPMV